MIKVLEMIDDATIGGGQQHLLWLAESLDGSRFEVAVACEGRGYLVDELNKRGIPVYALSIANRLSFRSLAQCWRLMKLLAPDVLHTHGGTAGFYGRLISRITPVRAVVHTYHGLHYLHSDSRAKKLLHRFVDHVLLRFTDRIICVSEGDFDLGVRWGIVNPTAAMVIRNGIDIARYSRYAYPETSTQRRNARIGQTIVGTIGRLHVQKGQIYLLEAARLVLNKYPSTIFQIIGTGELERQLKEKAIELGIADHVQFLGARTDVPDLLAAMDLFVLPSLWEGQPITLMEAMASCTPIIATDIDGISEMIEPSRDGLLVPAGNASDLADAIALLLSDSSLAQKLSQHAFDKVVREFDIRKMVRLTEETYTSLVAHSRVQ